MQLSDLLKGVPEKQQAQFLTAYVHSIWEGHLGNLKLIRDKSNPLSRDALRELIDQKYLAQQVLASELLVGTNAQPIVGMLARLDIEGAAIRFARLNQAGNHNH